MLRSYKLRLSDGTVLAVDHDGLSAWLVDGKAMVQVGNSGQWRPLREFLASERASAARAARQKRSPSREELPLIPPPPRKDPEDSATPDRPLPLIPPPPRRDPKSSAARDRPLPLVPPPPRRDATSSADPEPTPFESLPLIAPPQDEPVLAAPDPDELAEPHLFGDPSANDPLRDPVEPHLLGEPAGIQILADEPGAPRSIERSAVAPTGEPSVIRLKPLEEPLLVEEAPAASPALTPEDEAVGLPPEDEPPAVRVRDVRILTPAPEPSRASPRTLPRPSETTPRFEGSDTPRPATDPKGPPRVLVRAEDPMGSPRARGLADEPVRRAGGQVLADHPVSGAKPAPARLSPTPVERLPVIPLKPLDGDAQVPARAAARRRIEEPDARTPVVGLALRSGGLGETLLHSAAAFGTVLSRLFEPINRLERRSASLSLDEPEPWNDKGPAASFSSESVEDGGVQRHAALVGRNLRNTASAWIGRLPAVADRLTDWLARVGSGVRRLSDSLARLVTSGDRPILSIGRSAAPDQVLGKASNGPDPSFPAESLPDRFTPPDRWGPAVRSEDPGLERLVERSSAEPSKPPPGIDKLTVLRFAETVETEEPEHVYDGPEGGSFLPAVWLWTRRLVVSAGLVAGGLYAALHWEAWFPRTAEIGHAAFTEIDRHARSVAVTKEHEEVLQEISDQLPHLAPETIRLVLSSGPAGALDAPTVFDAATEAATRGLASLAYGEARELETIERELLDGLRPRDREHVREYDRARARGAVFDIETRFALVSYARGARALPAERLERLQSLLGKAVGAGLAPGTDSSPLAAPAR